MGCGSGRAIAEIVSGRQPELDFAFTGMARNSVTRAMISTPAHVKHS
jgi:D-amino-acid dehydrogenase